MWQIFAALSFYNVSMSYGGYTDCNNAANLPLDEIEVAGRALMASMLVEAVAQNIEFAEYALRLLTDYDFFIEEVQPPEDRTVRYTNKRWYTHLYTSVDPTLPARLLEYSAPIERSPTSHRMK